MSAVNDLQGSAVAAPDHAAVAPDDTDVFPAAPYADAFSYFQRYRQEIAHALATVDPATIEKAASILLDAYARGASVFSCGNGGSASIANHLQCDHVKGVGNGTDLMPRVMSLCANVEILTAIANDLAYEKIFSHQLQLQARPGDVLVIISSSGRSANIVNALTWARANDLRTIALTGFEGGDARLLAEVAIHVDSANYGIVEDAHQTVMHALAQYIRQSRMSAEEVRANVF
jgi:D-sedoheptulose 7-phosphate isomerase/D-glycero-D-manno-heptose 1,7-bisphosphate phosphatase